MGSDTVGHLALIAAAFAFGVGSGILPVILNAEVYVVGMGALVPHPYLLFAILSLGAGTVLGKAIVFELVRRGSTKVTRSVERRPPRNRLTRFVRKGGDRMLTMLSHPYLGAGTVLASSLTGVPPLAVVTVLAGASRQPLWLFLLMVGLGRTAQFLVLASVVHQIRF
jgi:membrane protein YqaA with SNARE-associated domain